MLTLHYHPLSSYCWKALIALYETQTAFVPHLVNLQNPDERAALCALWSVGKFPVLVDDDEGARRVIPESSIIIELLAVEHDPRGTLIPADPDVAREVRLYDRYFDLYVHNAMGRIVADRLRPAEHRDPYGLAEAKAQLAAAYEAIDARMATRTWCIGDLFTMADCAAAPALFYGHRMVPIAARHRHALAYLERLRQRPSFARVLREAEPYFHMVPQ